MDRRQTAIYSYKRQSIDELLKTAVLFMLAGPIARLVPMAKMQAKAPTRTTETCIFPPEANHCSARPHPQPGPSFQLLFEGRANSLKELTSRGPQRLAMSASISNTCWLRTAVSSDQPGLSPIAFDRLAAALSISEKYDVWVRLKNELLGQLWIAQGCGSVRRISNVSLRRPLNRFDQ